MEKGKEKDDISTLLETKLRLVDDGRLLIVKDPRSEVLQREIDKSGFQIFTCVSDHGFFSWKPTGAYIALDEATTSDIKAYLDTHGKPDKLVSISTLKLPRRFVEFDAQTFRNSFPYGQTEIVALHVASRYRNVDMARVDFAFGGSTLEMLAQKVTRDPYFAVQVPSTNAILIMNGKEYEKNCADLGSQFEHFVVGNNKGFTQGSQLEFVGHLHLMQIGRFRVLFQAESDALHKSSPVEVKFSNPRYWGTKVMFQMISNGSTMLCSGTKVRKSICTRVDLRPLSRVAQDALEDVDIRTLERNIINGMERLKTEIERQGSVEEGRVFRIIFKNGELALLPALSTRSAVVLPHPTVVRDML